MPFYKMKIIFWGNGEFALVSLKKLASRYQILGVVASPDKRKGRGLKIGIDPIKEFSQRQRFSIYQPENFLSDFIDTLKKDEPELFIVVNYGRKLTKEILSIPKIYSINLHPSLLPRYRGPAPINWVLINGEKKTGISVIKIGERIDAGEIIYQKEIEIREGENAGQLGRRLAEEGALALLETIELIRHKKVVLAAQNEKEATYFPKLNKSDGEIDWSKPASQIHNLIRGFTPEPGAFTFWRGKRIKLWKTRVAPKKFASSFFGEILKIDRDKGILVSTGRNGLWIEELQIEGRRRMSSKEFIIGHRISENTILGRTKVS
ncbi:MAG: methionyl-tRNA formyltransferase [Candidatus Omnitrophica bacterium]|nr:methionyl-tRNA formyltransferase [Candidatus Omnitrophota bacterium]